MYYRPPPLIDRANDGSAMCFDDRVKLWYAAKCLPYHGLAGFIMRLRHAWLVLWDRARAVRYHGDLSLAEIQSDAAEYARARTKAVRASSGGPSADIEARGAGEGLKHV